MNRAERRRREKDEDRRLARGFDSRLPAGPQMAALMRALGRKLEVAIQRRSVSPLMDFVHANMSAGTRLIADVGIACGRGCSHCCHSWVDASAPEVLYAVKAMSPAARLRALGSVARICEQTGGKSFDERTALVTPCPLLQDHMCTVYEARPIVCRAAASADAAACSRSYLELSGEGIPVPSVWRVLGQGYAVALEAAILHAGLVPAAREWNESLRLALADPGAEARWLAGEDVFGAAPRATEGGTFANPAWAAIYREAFGSGPPTAG